MRLICGISAFLLLAIDIFTKHLALTRLKPIGNLEVIGGFLDFTFVENRGAAFGMLSGRRWLFVILTLIVVTILIYLFVKFPKNREYNWVRISFVLIFAGAVGNMIDRFFRGYVVDFLEVTFISFPVFNMADIYVVTGTALLMFLVLFVIKEEPK